MNWLSNRSKVILLLALTLQLIVLAVMIARPYMTLATGDTILLEVVPVDPRDLFKGDYVILSYDISRPPQNGFGSRYESEENKTIYVTIEKDEDGKHWHAKNHLFEKPTGTKFIRGRIASWNQIKFGIEEFYVQEGTGKTYEDAVHAI